MSRWAISLLLALVANVTGPSSIRAVAAEGFTFESDGSNVTVTGCDGVCPTSIAIPQSLGGQPVRAIGAASFDEESITTITLPETLTSIANDAFYGNALTSVVIPDSVTTIGEWAFSTNNLTEVTLGTSVAEIGNYAFEDNALTTINIPNSTVTIGDYAFEENALTSIVIPSSVVSIGAFSFSNNVLASAKLGSSLASIGYAAFYINRLESIELPKPIESIGAAAFQNNQLRRISLSNSVETIGEAAFADNLLGKLYIPASVQIIEARAFAFNKLSRVQFEGNAPALGVDVFLENPELLELRRRSMTTGWEETRSGLPVRSFRPDTVGSVLITVVGPRQGLIVSDDGFSCSPEDAECNLAVRRGALLRLYSVGAPGIATIEWTGCTSVLVDSCIVDPVSDITISSIIQSRWQVEFLQRRVKFRLGARAELRDLAIDLRSARDDELITVIGFSRSGGPLASLRAQRVVQVLRSHGVISPIAIEFDSSAGDAKNRAKAIIEITWSSN